MKIKHICVFLLLALSCGVADGEDWPMWRRDAARSATSPVAVPAQLHLQWVRKLPPLKAAYRNSRLQFDAGYEPVVLGKTMFVASSRSDSVMAIDVESGAEKWRFYADGPIRFAPAAGLGKIYFGSDDGCLYCLDAETGSLKWKYRAAPSQRLLLGNRRLISVWPIRGGPVLHAGKIYFAAGVWPFEGVFIYSLDAETGQVVWLNDSSGFIYGQHPHAAEAFGGLTPQGYLVVHGDQLIVPCGAALPARFDLKTGKLIEFDLPKEGRYPGGWFTASKAVRRGEAPRPKRELLLDNQVNSDRHENGLNTGPGAEKVRTTITLGGRKIVFAKGNALPVGGVEGEIHTMLFAADKLFVVTREGGIYCFGEQAGQVKTHESKKNPLPSIVQSSVDRARDLLVSNARQGYALIWGVDDGGMIEELARITELNIIALDPDVEKVNRLRRRWDEAGLYGERLHLMVGSAADYDFPSYIASLIASEKPYRSQKGMVARSIDCLRPYGGAACFVASKVDLFDALNRQKGIDVEQHGKMMVARRRGALSGATDYVGGWKSSDQLVKAPLGVLWFGDEVGHFKRAPQPKILGGVMISHDKSWRGWPEGDRPPYKLTKAIFSDIYTGRIIASTEKAIEAAKKATLDIQQKQPEQYRPPQQKNAWSPKPPVIGTRMNPLTGALEQRAIIKSYGCDGGNDYGYLFTMRSGTAAFYDKRIESGTIHISGPRSGCTNSVIPAGGLLNVPYFYQGCTCSYPLPVGLAMISMPPTHEQWTVWGKGGAGPIQRLGLNIGAPGDRATEAGTLWLDWPVVGGPSPETSVAIEPKTAHYFYRHSLWIEGGKGWPWVAASGVEGLSSLSIDGLKEGEFTVRLYFSDPENSEPGRRVFDVALQGKSVLKDLDIARQCGGAMRSVVYEFKGIACDGKLNISFAAKQGQPILCGVELALKGLSLGDIPQLHQRETAGLSTNSQ